MWVCLNICVEACVYFRFQGFSLTWLYSRRNTWNRPNRDPLTTKFTHAATHRVTESSPSSCFPKQGIALFFILCLLHSLSSSQLLKSRWDEVVNVNNEDRVKPCDSVMADVHVKLHRDVFAHACLAPEWALCYVSMYLVPVGFMWPVCKPNQELLFTTLLTVTAIAVSSHLSHLSFCHGPPSPPLSFKCSNNCQWSQLYKD